MSLKCSHTEQIESVFCGANISNCVFNININNLCNENLTKRRRLVIEESDEDSVYIFEQK